MSEGLRVAVGSDHAGYALKEQLVALLREQGHEVQDLGTHGEASVDYPDYGHAVAESVAGGGAAALGLLVCGTGVGMAMSANRHPGVRAVVCSDTFSARIRWLKSPTRKRSGVTYRSGVSPRTSW